MSTLYSYRAPRSFVIARPFMSGSRRKKRNVPAQSHAFGYIRKDVASARVTSEHCLTSHRNGFWQAANTAPAASSNAE
ncbi:hypothetical protein LMG28614_04360 [Paraburkholderia ultramafica]|uniref:Uncharacterized protein n=1 Tax=Paraburkholderia ultramafica TaxID=1544867 RepID=A0A6S7D5B0_9BURK|nr:hypothetical protein LMG28614_04360 [Paraburkholderia ultramafica]